MTEIPEHLLKRSKARRAAIDDDADGGSEGGDTGGETEASAAPGASAAPATTSAAPAVPAEPVAPEPEPVRPEVAAYQNRRRVPYWALPVIAFLPVWAYLFQGTLSPVAEDDAGPLGHGGAIFASQCASCHGSGGGGGVGPPLGEVVDHWPDHRDQAMWVRLGSTGWPGDTRGATEIPVGAGMPGFTGLSDAELAEVVLYTRVTHAGLDPESDEALELIEIAEGEKTFAEVGLGELSEEAGVTEDQLDGAG